MKIWKIATIVALATVAATLFTASVYANINGRRVFNTYDQTLGVSSSYNNYGRMMGGYGGMMGGYGYYGYPSTGTQTQFNTATQPIPTSCPHQYRPATADTSPINITAANIIAQNYLTELNNPDFTIAQVEEYTQNFYVQIREKSTGFGAFELTIDKYTGAIYPEMGPNMMWNTKYRSANNAGMMVGMMNGCIPFEGTPTTTLPTNVTLATASAQQFLNVYYPGTTAGDITTFYGYYTIEVLSAGNPYGMLSVNGYTGQVWYHTWHGTFIQEIEL